MNLDKKLRDILSRLNTYFKAQDIKSDDNLFNIGALDSLMLIQFVVSIEDEFRIRILNEDINYDNFSTLAILEGHLRSKYIKNV